MSYSLSNKNAVEIMIRYEDGSVERAEGTAATQIWDWYRAAEVFHCIHGASYDGPRMTRINKAHEIKPCPCPFCGGIAHIVKHSVNLRESYAVTCKHQGCCWGTPVSADEASAVELWNKKYAPAVEEPTPSRPPRVIPRISDAEYNEIVTYWKDLPNIPECPIGWRVMVRANGQVVQKVEKARQDEFTWEPFAWEVVSEFPVA